MTLSKGFSLLNNAIAHSSHRRTFSRWCPFCIEKIDKFQVCVMSFFGTENGEEQFKTTLYIYSGRSPVQIVDSTSLSIILLRDGPFYCCFLSWTPLYLREPPIFWLKQFASCHVSLHPLSLWNTVEQIAIIKNEQPQTLQEERMGQRTLIRPSRA